MGTAASRANDRAHPICLGSSGGLHWVVRTLPTVLILGALAGVAYWGHRSGWAFSTKAPRGAVSQSEGQPEPRPVLRFSPASPGEGPLFSGQSARIEFASADEANALGIDINLVWPTPLTEQVSTPGEVSFDSNRIAHLSAKAKGVARRVFKAAGDSVRAGELIALIESPDLGRAKAELQHALVQSKLKEKTRDDLSGAQAAVSPAQLREVEAAVKEASVRLIEATQELTNLGFQVKVEDYRSLAPTDVVKRLRYLGVEDAVTGADKDVLPANLLPIRAPFAGVLLSADAVTGEVIEGGKPLFTLVDPTRVWITLHLGAQEVQGISIGQKVFFRPDGSAHEHSAAVTWLGTAADEITRTVAVRAEAENSNGVLRASTLGKGRVILREQPKALVVPHEAVQVFRGQPVVFVRDADFMKPSGPKTFHVRSVRTGGRDDRNTEILAGVSSGEVVATKGGAALLSVLTQAIANR